MAKERDESGEVKSNKAGVGQFHDEETHVIPSSVKHGKPAKPEMQDQDDEAEKTRVIFGAKKSKSENPSGEEDQKPASSRPDDFIDAAKIPCVGWLVVWEGPGMGASHVLRPGNNTIGRSAACDVALLHGDQGISSDGKISIDYEYRGHTYAFVNRGSTNTPYLNDKPIRTEQELKEGDKLLIGDTVLIFVPFCSPERNWSES